MKKTLMTLAAVAGFALVTTSPATAQERPGKEDAEQVTVTAQVVDLSCKVVHGLSGEDHRMCAQVCADAGVPLALLTDDGDILMPVSMGMPGSGDNERLKPHAERTVRVKGKLIERGGMKSIVIEEISAN